jgi:hypothetical protein
VRKGKPAVGVFRAGYQSIIGRGGEEEERGKIKEFSRWLQITALWEPINFTANGLANAVSVTVPLWFSNPANGKIRLNTIILNE